jgi:hypothetical protein
MPIHGCKPHSRGVEPEGAARFAKVDTTPTRRVHNSERAAGQVTGPVV